MLKILLMTLLLPAFCYGQEISVIQEQDYNDASFKSLMFLKEELKDVKVVGLGESAHWLKRTYISKVQMVKFLHENCGFDVIAFEAPIYNLDSISAEISAGTITPADIRRNNSGVWGFPEVVELYKYVLETQETDRPLIYAGFDESFFRTPQLVLDYKVFVDSLSQQAQMPITLDSTFYDALARTAGNSYYFGKIPPADTLLLYEKLNLIKTVYAGLENKTTYFSYWNRLTENLQGLYGKSYHTSNRDENMAKNVSFLAKERYPDKKIMLWAATIHLVDNKTQGLDVKRVTKPKMGYFLKKEFGGTYYIMAFSPYTGKGGVKGYLGLMTRKVRTKKDSIERYVNDTYGCDYAYLSMRSDEVKALIEAKELDKANILGLKPHEMDIPNIVDGIFYMREEQVLGD